MLKKWYDGTEYCDQDDLESIRSLLIGRRVVDVHESGYLTLDNGTVLRVEPNSGCSCGSGCYWIDHLERVNNAITNVELSRSYTDAEDYDTAYRIYVYANGMQHELLRVVGSDGNGYYGTGYELVVRVRGEGEADEA